MRISFRFTPFDATRPALGERLAHCLRDPRFTRLDAIVAWAKRSGLARLQREITRFRARGGKVSMIVGIDERGATREGLELVRQLADEAWIFQDPHGGTFHPKVYLFRGQNVATAFVGSSNLTRGGHYDNYEASIELEMALPADAGTLTEVEHWIELVRSEPELCIEVTEELVARVVSAGAARSESERENWTGADREGPAVLLPFGRPRHRHVTAPVLAEAATAGPARPGASTLPARAAASFGRAVGRHAATPAQIVDRWFKRLDRSGAQQPPQAGTNVTGVLRLTQSGFPIDWRTYFRNSLFGAARWRPRTVSGRPGEETTIAFEVTIDARYVGRHSLAISHASHREAGQANVTTVLHWGSLMPMLRASNHTGYWVVLSRTSDRRHQLSIQRQRPA